MSAVSFGREELWVEGGGIVVAAGLHVNFIVFFNILGTLLQKMIHLNT